MFVVEASTLDVPEVWLARSVLGPAGGDGGEGSGGGCRFSMLPPGGGVGAASWLGFIGWMWTELISMTHLSVQ